MYNQEKIGFVSCLVLLATCSAVAIWISIGSYNAANIATLRGYQIALTCHQCAECMNSRIHCKECTHETEDECQRKGFKYRDIIHGGQITEKCFESQVLKNEISNITGEEFTTARKHIHRNAHEMAKYTGKAEETFYQPMKYIIHWMVEGALKDITTGWTTVHQYEHHPSLYSVSSGPDGSYDNGTVLVMESGMYLIYSKMAFACKEADLKLKRINIEVQIHLAPSAERYTAMRDVQEGVCGIKGGLLTSYQSGIFSLSKGNKISIRFKVPDNVILSADGYKGYRSNIGVTRIGIA